MLPDIRDHARHKWLDILTGLGIDSDLLVNRHVRCPLCERKKFRFDNKNGNGTYICVCSSGTGITLAMNFIGENFKNTCDEIRKIIGVCRMETVKPVDDEKTINQNRKRLKGINAGLVPITPDTAAGRYLVKRGLTVLPALNCKSHPGLPYFEDGKKLGVFPAMVATVTNADGEPATFHVTYLTPEGCKLDCKSPKKLLPTTRKWKGGCIRLFKPTDILGIAEGIETCLAAYQTYGYPMWCAVNYLAMQAIKIPDSIKTVVIYVDEDRSFSGQQAAYTLARLLVVQENKEVLVNRLIGDELVCYVDKGLDKDFLDYLNRNVITSKRVA